jgi:mono/diheme cytochrome c family protein
MRLGVAILAAALLAAASPAAEAVSAGTPRLDYLLHCSGCHGPTGAGVPSRGIPRLRGEVAKFLWVPEGRAYLAQVPGVRNANLDDAEVARLLSWLPGAMDPDHLPLEPAPFSAEEVSTLRRSAQGDVLARRAAVGDLLAAQGIELRSYQD